MMRLPHFRMSLKLLICSLFTLSTISTFFACKKSDKVTTPPPAVSYRQKVISIAEDVAMLPVKPDSTGGPITEYAINPLLPKGLSLNTANGEISGTPSDTLAATQYVVTAKGPGGTAHDTITMLIGTVAFNYGPTGVFTFEKDSRDLVATAISPVVLAGTFNQFVITAPFPDSFTIKTGLTFNPRNGQISGVPKTLTSTSEFSVPAFYTITGISTTGKTASATISITVNDKKPNFYYSFSGSFTQNYSVGSVLTPSISVNSGVIKKFRLAANSPALPTGLTLDSTTGSITGTIGASATSANIVVRGINNGGYTDITVPLVISSTPQTPDVRYMMSIISGNVADTICSRILTGNNIYLTKSDGIGNAAVYLNPVANAGQLGTFTATPALPTGMNLSSSGLASGTPSAAAGSYSSAITINNAIGGGPTGSFTMNTVVNSPFFVYDNKNTAAGNPNCFLFVQNQKVDVINGKYPGFSSTVLTPLNGATNGVVRYAIFATNTGTTQPFVNTGLTFNTTTGGISGTPTTNTNNNSTITSFWDYIVVGYKADGSFTYYKIRIKIYPTINDWNS